LAIGVLGHTTRRPPLYTTAFLTSLARSLRGRNESGAALFCPEWRVF
jgi:hypothetical protein